MTAATNAGHRGNFDVSQRGETMSYEGGRGHPTLQNKGMPDQGAVPTPSLASAIGSTVNSALPSTTRRSTRKHKEREEFLLHLSAALMAYLCGRSTAPSDDPKIKGAKRNGIISGAWNKAVSQIIGSMKPAYLLGVFAETVQWRAAVKSNVKRSYHYLVWGDEYSYRPFNFSRKTTESGLSDVTVTELAPSLNVSNWANTKGVEELTVEVQRLAWDECGRKLAPSMNLQGFSDWDSR
ncbi:hypothetical protein FB451DRAFT_1170584 [Mycena latifolia]|nr:hypothetical protein FB451DRAFT_1170584 [Mycena latifolia]